MNINFVVIKFLIIQSEIRLERQIKEYNIKKNHRRDFNEVLKEFKSKIDMSK